MPDGNTRTTAVFVEKYLNSMEFEINNDVFEKHSTYFRNALVRASYTFKESNTYLRYFFEDLLKDQTHELNSKDLIIKELYPEQDKELEIEL